MTEPVSRHIQRTFSRLYAVQRHVVARNRKVQTALQMTVFASSQLLCVDIKRTSGINLTVQIKVLRNV